MAYISINFELYKEEDAKILVTDLALQRGYGIFDFLKTVNGQIIFATDHFNRFYNSAKERDKFGYLQSSKAIGNCKNYRLSSSDKVAILYKRKWS